MFPCKCPSNKKGEKKAQVAIPKDFCFGYFESHLTSTSLVSIPILGYRFYERIPHFSQLKIDKFSYKGHRQSHFKADHVRPRIQHEHRK